MTCQTITPQYVIDRWKDLAQKIQDERDFKNVTSLSRQLSEGIDRCAEILDGFE